MLLAVVELARRCGLTVRSLHHDRAYAGNDSGTHVRIREAYAREPDLRSGSAVDPTLLGYVQKALGGKAQQGD